MSGHKVESCQWAPKPSAATRNPFPLRTRLDVLYDHTTTAQNRACPNSPLTAALGTTPVPRHLLSVKNVSEQVRTVLPGWGVTRLLVTNDDRIYTGLSFTTPHTTTVYRAFHIRMQGYTPLRLTPLAHGTTRKSTPCR